MISARSRVLPILCSILLTAASSCWCQDNDLAEQVFRNPYRYLPEAAAVFQMRGYDPGSLREIPQSLRVYILGKDAYSRAAFEEIKTTITDPSLKALSLDNPDHSFAFPYRGACFVKLTEPTADKIKFIATWTGIPPEFIEQNDVSMEGEELGMALHELVHCTQPKDTPVAAGETEADLAFVRAQPLSHDANLLRQTMHLRALFALNTGIQRSGSVYSPAQRTYYPAALSFDAILHGAQPPDPELSAQAYDVVNYRMSLILGYQTQKAGGFKRETPHFAQIAIAAKSFIEVERRQRPENDQEKLALRAAELYMDGLNYFLPAFAGSLEEKYGRIDYPY